MSLLGGLGGNLATLGLAGAAINPAFMFSNAVAFGTDLYNAYNQQQNYELQKDMFKYQKDLQKRIFAREDNSVQRRVTDLQAAGLSPVLAAGQGASAGAIVSTKAPQRDNIQMASPEMMMAALKMDNDFANSKVQRELIEKQKKATDAQAALSSAGALIKLHDYSIYKKTGTTSNASSTISDIRNLLNIIDEKTRSTQEQKKQADKVIRNNEGLQKFQQDQKQLLKNYGFDEYGYPLQ